MRSQETPSPGGQAYRTEINGRVYEAYLLSATRGNEIFVILVKVLGPAISSAINITNLSKFKESKDMLDINLDIPSILKILVDNLKVDEYMDVVKTLTGTCTCDGSRIEFDGHFRGRYGEMFKVLAWTIKINFEDILKDFFFEAESTLPSKEDQAEEQSKSQST